MILPTSDRKVKERIGPLDYVFEAVLIHYRLAICAFVFGLTIFLMPGIIDLVTITLPQIVLSSRDILMFIALIAMFPGFILFALWWVLSTWPYYPPLGEDKQ